ncbi:MAG: hypothetical protein K9N22_06025 [Candidatus Marinimicrobia bacterium]|nr:hypothetical protein [Candidatus Neomarinimicrobiota bacterium]
MKLFPIIGQDNFLRRLQNLLSSGRLGHSHLFTGPEGSGKDALALQFAAMLNCTGEGDKPCGDCSSCHQYKSLEHTALHLIFALPNKSKGSDEPDPYKGFNDDDMAIVQAAIAAKAKNPYQPIQLPGANNIRIASIRKLRQDVYLSMNPGITKTVVILEAHKMNGESFNALLKILEEPPDRTVFILTTAYPDRIPTTILSRCQYYRIPPITTADLQGHLEDHFELPPPEAHVLARLSQGNVRQATYYAADSERKWLEVLRQIVKVMLSKRYSELRALVKQLADKKNISEETLQQTLSVFILFLRDVGVGQSDEQQTIWQEERDALLAWSPHFDAREAVARVERCKDALDRKVYFPLALTRLFFELRQMVRETQKEYQQ